jgi:hypothetical protein
MRMALARDALRFKTEAVATWALFCFITFALMAPLLEVPSITCDQRAPESTLRAQVQAIKESNERGALRYLDRLPPAEAQPGEWFYIRKIADLCHSRGVKLVFVTIPLFGNYHPFSDDAAYARFGTVIRIDSVSGQPNLYWNGGHLNQMGAIVATDSLARWIAPLLAS